MKITSSQTPKNAYSPVVFYENKILSLFNRKNIYTWHDICLIQKHGFGNKPKHQPKQTQNSEVKLWEVQAASAHGKKRFWWR